jgi:hypothetical protein
LRISKTITWSNNFGEITSKLSIKIDMIDSASVLTLDYTCDGEPYKYDIQLTSIPSNLGKGSIWFFICPLKLKRCSKLHLINGSFMHRSNLPTGMYECQTKSKK